MSRGTKLDSATDATEGAIGSAADSVNSAVESVSDAVEALVSRGRRARKAAKGEADRRRKLAKKHRNKVKGKANRALADVKSDASYRSEALAAVVKGKPKRGKKRRIIVLLGLIGAGAAVARGKVGSQHNSAPKE